MKKFVRIQSEIDITVTGGLQNVDLSNPDAHIADRLKVNALWPRLAVRISRGAHWYPSEIAEWNTVKNLQKDKLLTIGEFSDSCDESGVQDSKEKLVMSINEVKEEMAKAKKSKKLEEIAED